MLQIFEISKNTLTIQLEYYMDTGNSSATNISSEMVNFTNLFFIMLR